MTGVAVGVHSSLGLRAYAKTTSPIRRYTDVLVHRQLKALLAGTPLPYARDDLAAVLVSVLDRERAVGRMQALSDRYWTLVHLGMSEAFDRGPRGAYRAASFGAS